MTKIVLITGASSGIGEAFAKLFAEKDYDLVITARRQEKLDQLAKILRQAYQVNVYVISVDLSQQNAPKRLFEYCQQKNIQID